MAEFERIAEQEKQAFTQASLSIYPHQAEFIDKVLAVASGEKARNEENDYREISIFKNGVTL